MQDDNKREERSWLDLPDALTEIVLNRLTLRAYVVFAAVCRRWRSIQTAHRLAFRRAPRPPPACYPQPCLLSSSLELGPAHRQYYSPFEPAFYPLPLSDEPAAAKRLKCLGSNHGWLLLYDPRSVRRYQPFLFNPVSGSCVQLRPPPPPTQAFWSFAAAISSPPTDPRCAVLLVDVNDVFLHLLNTDKHCRPFFLRRKSWLQSGESLHSVVYAGEKFYCVSSKCKLFVIEPFLATPTVIFLHQMDSSQVAAELRYSLYYLVESEGEVLVVVVPADRDNCWNEGFKVFRADIASNVWVRVENLGDRAFFVAEKGSFSFPAAEVGCKKNCIYYTQGIGTLNAMADLAELWKMFEVFDLETGDMINAQPVPNTAIIQRVCDYNKRDLCWFVPELEQTEADGVEGIDHSRDAVIRGSNNGPTF